MLVLVVGGRSYQRLEVVGETTVAQVVVGGVVGVRLNVVEVGVIIVAHPVLVVGGEVG
jgi:hypothetical protein